MTTILDAVDDVLEELEPLQTLDGGTLAGVAARAESTIRTMRAEIARLKSAHNGEICVDVQEAYDALRAEVERLKKEKQNCYNQGWTDHEKLGGESESE